MKLLDFVSFLQKVTLNILLFYVAGGKKRLSFVRFPGKQESFFKNVNTVCWSVWQDLPMQS